MNVMGLARISSDAGARSACDRRFVAGEIVRF